MRRRLCLLAPLAAALSACAGRIGRQAPPRADPDMPGGPPWRARRVRMADLTSWDMDGRMAVRTADDGGSASFFWQRDGRSHRIEMFGPFGGGRVTIEEDAAGAVMRDGNDERIEADTAEQLLFIRVGWHVPFESLAHWLKGVPAPGSFADLRVDEQGRALGFSQDGWDIRVLNYEGPGPDALPRRVFAKALPGTVHLVDDAGRDLGDRLEVKVVIRGWQPRTPAEMR